MYRYGLIGNCQISALVSELGSIDWLCLPRPDSPPVLGKLLDPDGGHFSIHAPGGYQGAQAYLPNTAVLTTTLSSPEGNQFRITDFCPRFYLHGRMYRPMMLFRVVEPLAGSVSLTISCRPVNGWDKEPLRPVRGNSHLRFDCGKDDFRLTTNMPLTYLCEETEFGLKEPLYFALTWGLGLEDDLVSVARRFLAQTADYWSTWVKHCSIPTLYQKETIRSALTLKLHCYEDTGAILAALTTSLPEEPGASRNWDYRFCWLRDAYFVLSAFHRLGHFEEMEGFLKFLLSIGEKHEQARESLHPVYKLDQSLPLPELEHPKWKGFMNSRPVRSNNLAAEQVQNDVYGEMILTLAPIFFDDRFHHLRTPEHEDFLGHMARICSQVISKPDAGLWELRNGWQEHSFSNLMCWAGLDRIQKIQERGFLRGLALDVPGLRDAAKDSLLRCVKDGALRNGPRDDSLDSALLQIAILGFPDSDVTRRTVDQIRASLALADRAPDSSFLYRYRRADDFGLPASAFLICSFWLVHALARTGQAEEASAVMKDAMSAAGPLGLFSEHYAPGGRLQGGNFPQAYSHVGQINAAFAVSTPWSDFI